jgi:hypothetical protein
MRFYLIILLLPVLIACGSARIKTVRTTEIDREIVMAAPTASGSDGTDLAKRSTTPENTTVHSDALPFDDSSEDIKETPLSPAPRTTEDDPEISNSEKLSAAIATERKAKRGKNLLTSSFIVTLFSWLFPPILLASIVLLILGIIHYSEAKNARFITLQGERHLKRTKGMLLANIILFSLIIVLIGGVVILYLF